MKSNFSKSLSQLKSDHDDLKIEDSCIANEIKFLEVTINDFKKKSKNSDEKSQILIKNSRELDLLENNLKSQLEEQERDADDILKKYQNHIQNVNF